MFFKHASGAGYRNVDVKQQNGLILLPQYKPGIYKKNISGKSLALFYLLLW